jgi:hypothetical protein
VVRRLGRGAQASGAGALRRAFRRALMLACVGLLGAGSGQAFAAGPGPEPAPRGGVLRPEPSPRAGTVPRRTQTTSSRSIRPSTSSGSTASSSAQETAPSLGQSIGSAALKSMPRKARGSTPPARTTRTSTRARAKQRSGRKPVARVTTRIQRSTVGVSKTATAAGSPDPGLLLAGGLLFLAFLVGDAVFLAAARLSVSARDGE